ncbi:MAG: aromatic ring-hydroxylating dioxygenase subunit alpha [Pseudomonadota bacterium]
MTISVLRARPGDVPFSLDPRRSVTMPARYYFDSEIFEAEKEAIFYRSWWCIGHKSQVAQAGQFIQANIHDQNVFAVRAKDGSLNAFYNVCQHRGHELVSGRGRSQVITCPYHAWTYGLDGSLRAARNSKNVDGFDACLYSLKPVRVEDYAGFIFINVDPDAIPLREQAGSLEEEIRHYCPQIDDLVFAQRDTYDVRANWKVLVDNFLECYHCAPAHKDFVDLVDMDSYRTVTHGLYSAQISDAPRTTDSKAFTFEKGDVDFGYAGWFLWPNLSIWVYPGEPNISTLQMLPAGPERCIEYQDWFIPTPKPTPQLRDAMAYQKDVLQPEDIGLCESVQRGLKTKGYNQGRFIVDRDMTELSEHAVHHFQTMVVDALGGALDGQPQG